MATSIPPHNLNEVADAVIKVIDDPECTIDDLLEVMPGPDFPTGGIICGREGIRQGYLTGPFDDHAPRGHAFRDREEFRRDRGHRDSVSRNA